MGKIRTKESGNKIHLTIDFTMVILRGLSLNSRAGKGKDYHAGFRRVFFGNN